MFVDKIMDRDRTEQGKFKPVTNRPIVKNAIGVRFYLDNIPALDALGKDKHQFIRDAIAEKLERSKQEI